MKILSNFVKNKSILTVLAALITIDILSVVIFCKSVINYPVHNFNEVVPGILYRSAQPDPDRWPVLRDKYHIRAVINFRYDDPGDEAMQFEKEFCKDNNIKLVRIALDAAAPTKEELKKFMDTIQDPDNQPVLVHCELGRSRTGVMVAAYRIKQNGWSAEKAIEESHIFKKNMRPIYVKYLRSLQYQRIH
jgi:protein tyrosine/serine phosphatase